MDGGAESGGGGVGAEDGGAGEGVYYRWDGRAGCGESESGFGGGLLLRRRRCKVGGLGGWWSLGRVGGWDVALLEFVGGCMVFFAKDERGI